MNTKIVRMVWINGAYTVWLGCGCKFRSLGCDRHFIGAPFVCDKSDCRKEVG